MRKGQGNHRDVDWGVQVAELEGHRSRSAVYLVHHWEGLGPAPRGGRKDEPAGVISYEMGCYHTRSMNVL
jgi:hypothetical protein